MRVSLPLCSVLAVCLLCAMLVAYSVHHFTSFTWQHSPDLHPCEMSYFHLVHFPTAVLSSASPRSPTHDAQLLARVRNASASAAAPVAAASADRLVKKRKRKKGEAASAADQRTAAANASASFSLPSSFEDIAAAHAAGYRMLRYVEAGQDDSLLAARPVLFLHGSSGSYHQARSLFSRLNLVHHALHPSSPPLPDRHDYFSLDFAEEKSAMSGALLLRQAHYVNEALRTLAARYGLGEKGSWPGAVIVAHSMGGVVARLLPLLCNWLDGSVLAVYTLGAPHAAPVLVVDDDMRNVYIALSAAAGAEGGPHRLEDSVLLSLSGGVSDFFIEPALTVLPASRTVNCVAHSVPHVQTSIEHQTLCWCRQLMEVVARAIVTDAHRLPQSASPFLHPRGALTELHRQVVRRGEPLQATALLVDGSSALDVELWDDQTFLLLLEGRVGGVFLCPEKGWSAECVNGSEQLVSTSALYRHAAYFPAAPQLPSDEHHVLFSSSPHVFLSPSAASPATFQLRAVRPPYKPLLSLWDGGTQYSGVYRWSAYIPAGVDRYFDVSLQLQFAAAALSTTPPRVWLHFSSLRLDAAEVDLQEAQLITDVNVSTVIRYYRRPYARYATAIIFLPSLSSKAIVAVSSLSVSLSWHSYLRTVFLQLPMLPHLLLSAFLLLSAWQHHLLRQHHAFPFLWQLLTATPATQLAALFAFISLLFALSFAGTMFHAAAFVSGAALPAASSSRSITELIASSSLFTRINSNETGVAGLVVFLACLFLVFAMELVLGLLFSCFSLARSAARRLLPLSAAASALSSLRIAAQLLLSVALAVSLLSHVDGALLAHFGVSLSSTLNAALTVAAGAQRQLTALFVDSTPASSSAFSVASSSSVFSLLSYQLPLTLHIALVVAVFLLVQAMQWDSRQPSRCAYQLSCCSLMLLTAALATPTFLTTQRPFALSALPSSSSSHSQLISIPALHLVLLAASSSPPIDCPMLQPVVLLLYSFSLLFLHDASLSLQSLFFVIFVLLLCFLPHALQRCAAMLVDAVIAVDVRWGKRARRQHAE